MRRLTMRDGATRDGPGTSSLERVRHARRGAARASTKPTSRAWPPARPPLPPLAVLATACLAVAGCNGQEARLDPCRDVNCSHRGICMTDGIIPYCACLRGYRPDRLQCVRINPDDPCEGVDCAGHGTCRVEGSYPICDCNSGYRNEGRLLCLPGETPDADADADVDGDMHDGEVDVEPDVDVDREADADAEVSPYCGDGALDDGEECDDGNDVPGDGCEPETCRF
ncbi:MAG: DUF4215 domain-containing protein, partial [Myxococcota bacterium]|nr:DUF4215 domain-containing protein [Myxococcota bacterium]